MQHNENDFTKDFWGNPERIVCAAVWYPDFKPKVDDAQMLIFARPINVKEGIVVLGHRHPNCMYAFYAMTGNEKLADIQGFLTSTNRFVEREEAWVIAKRENQIAHLLGSDGTLYSENLY